jgi:hypothetical protein
MAVCYECHFVLLEFFAHEITTLTNSAEILALWRRISAFEREHKNINLIRKTCDDQILSLFNLLISKIDDDLKKTFERKDSVYHEFLKYCAYEGHCDLLLKNLDNGALLDLLSQLLKKREFWISKSFQTLLASSSALQPFAYSKLFKMMPKPFHSTNASFLFGSIEPMAYKDRRSRPLSH